MQGRKETLYQLRIKHNIYHQELQEACEARGLRASYLACITGAAIPKESAETILAAFNELAHTQYRLDDVEIALRPALSERDIEGRLQEMDQVRLRWLKTRMKRHLQAYRSLEDWFEHRGLRVAYHYALEKHVIV